MARIMSQKKLHFFHFTFVFALIVVLLIPQQSYAVQNQKFDGSKAYLTLWFDHAFADQIPAINAMVEADLHGAILVRTGVIGNPEYMTWNDLNFYANHGIEMIDHSVTHPIISPITSQGKLVKEVLTSKSTLQQHGFRVLGYLSPYDLITSESARLIDSHFKYSVVPSVKQNTVKSISTEGKQYGFNVPVLQHYGVGIPPGPPLNNFTAAKTQIDYAILHHTWLVLNFHQLDNKLISYHADPKLFQEILKYIKQKVATKQITVVTPSEGLGLSNKYTNYGTDMTAVEITTNHRHPKHSALPTFINYDLQYGQ